MRTQAKIFRSGITAVFVSMVATLATGCADLSNDLGDASMEAGWPVQNWDSVQGRPHVELTPVNYRHDVDFTVGSAGLSRVQENELRTFLAGLSLSANDEVMVVQPEYPNPLTKKRQEVVASFLMLNQVKAHAVVGDAAVAPAALNSIGVIVRRYTVKLPPCPDWTDAPKDSFSNRPGRNWGCSTAANLGMMVARPSDLDRGRKLGPADGEVQARAVTRYLNGKTMGLIRDAGSSDVFPAASGSE